jgi:hypothetical protein
MELNNFGPKIFSPAFIIYIILISWKKFVKNLQKKNFKKNSKNKVPKKSVKFFFQFFLAIGNLKKKLAIGVLQPIWGMPAKICRV